jgi:hypothetical protein
MMSGFALACFRGYRNNGKHGLYVSENFSLTGDQPSWTLFNDGIDGVPNRLAVDPFDPMRRQWVNVASEKILHRDTSLGDDWFEVLDLAQAHVITMSPEWSLGRNPRITGISCDPWVAGKIYVSYCWTNAQAAWWKDDYRRNHIGTYFLVSVDYGNNWSVISTAGSVARGAGEVWGCPWNDGVYNNHYLWAAVEPPVLMGGGGLFVHHLEVPPDAPWGVLTSRPIRYSSWKPGVKVDPTYPWNAYTCSWAKDSALLKFYGHHSVTSLTWDRADGRYFEDPLPLGNVRRISSSDHHWIDPLGRINPATGLVTAFHRYLMQDGRIYVTDRAWRFDGGDDPLKGAINPTPEVLVGGFHCRNLVGSNDRDGMVFFSSQHAIYGLHTDQSVTPVRLFTEQAGNPSYYGLYVDPDYLYEPPGYPHVYSVDLGEEGTEDPDSSGLHLHGDNAAYDTEWQATEHARDIKTAQFTYHNPYPGLPGTAPVSDGDIYVSTPILTLEPQIILYPADSTGIRYEFSVDGFNDAGEDAVAGDKIEVKGAGTLTGDLILADGVEYIGSKHIVIDGTIYHGVDSKLTGFTVEVTETDEDAICVIGAREGISYLYDCIVSARSENGDAFALSAELGGRIYTFNCDLSGISRTGEGYVGRSLRGSIRSIDGRTFGSTDVWYIGD